MKTIDMTPTWSGLLPALLDVVVSGSARLEAGHCDIEDEWCVVHQSYVDEQPDADDVCHIGQDPVLTSEFRAGLQLSVSDIRTELGRMAEAADRYNALAKFIRQTLDGLTAEKWPDGAVNGLDAIAQKLADLAGLD